MGRRVRKDCSLRVQIRAKEVESYRSLGEGFWRVAVPLLEPLQLKSWHAADYSISLPQNILVVETSDSRNSQAIHL